MKMRLLLSIGLLISFTSNAQLQISTVSQSVEELKIKSDLELLHKEYDLTPWLYTTKIHVDQSARTPYSHPVLTMSTQKEYLENRIKLLSTYLHEQLHWHVVKNGKPSFEEFTARVKSEFPIVKVGSPHGSRDEESTLNHIIVCYLEYVVLSKLVGQ